MKHEPNLLQIGRPRKDFTSFWYTMFVLALLLIVFALSACSTKQLIAGDPIPLTLTDPDRTLTKDCEDLTVIPDRELLQEEVEALWKEDRMNFKLCKVKHKGLVKYYKLRDEKLRDNRGK